MTAIESGETDTRERILDAARARFATDGFAGASVRRIAEDARVAKPMVFYYFGNKDELFRAVVESTRARLGARYRETVERASSARDAIAALARAHLEVAEHASDDIRFLARCVLTVGSAHNEALRRDHFDVIDAILDRVEATGIALPEREAARQLIRGVVSTYYMDAVSGAALSNTSPETLASLIWRALGAPEGNDSKS